MKAKTRTARDICFATLNADAAGRERLALAVSGGPDSMALMHLVAAWANSRDEQAPQITVLTVDHALRPESADETRFVADKAESYGFEAVTLRWDGPKPDANLQEEARNARYELMLGYCARNQIAALLTAHHMDDQAETMLMRLARGSGVDGLSGIPPKTQRKDVTILRPLLEVSKEELISILEEAQCKWMEDPSNDNDDFERVRIRRLAEELKSLGLTTTDLSLTAKRMTRARQVLDNAASTFLARAATLYDSGYCSLEFDPFCEVEEETALRALSQIAQAVGAANRPPQLAKLEELYVDLVTHGKKSATLAGCHFELRADVVTIVRELRKNTISDLGLRPGQEAVWDNRFSVRAPQTFGKAVVVRALTEPAFLKLRKEITVAPEMPSRAGASLVSFWHADKVVAVPHLHYTDEALADVTHGGSDKGFSAKLLALESFQGKKVEGTA